MIWKDKVGDILTSLNAQSVYSLNRSNTPQDLLYRIFNQAQDYLSTVKAWRDLVKTITVTLGSDRKFTYPSDLGSVMFVYADPSNIGKPMYYYYKDANDIARRYTEEVSFDPDTNAKTVKLYIPPNVFLPSNPTLVYTKTLDSITADDVDKYSFFPMNLMLIAGKKILQDYHGVTANQDPNWITQRMQEELRLYEAYAYQNNVPLEWSIHDIYGNNIYIGGSKLNGSKSIIGRPSPFLPSTIMGGGVY